MKGTRLTEGMSVWKNRDHEEKWPVHLMVEPTPVGKSPGRRRTNLRLVLSSPRDKVKTKASVSLRKEERCWKSKSRDVRESMWEKSFWLFAFSLDWQTKSRSGRFGDSARA